MIESSTAKPASKPDDVMIVSTPGTCGGRPRIDGHRIPVQDVVVWTEECGMSPEQIVEEYPGLSLAKVAAAISYYRAHPSEIREWLKEDKEFADHLVATSKMIRPARKLDAESHSNSPG